METTDALEKDWPFLLTLLPGDLEASAKALGALVRKRGVVGAGDLLRLAFAYGFCGLSLRATALWAHKTGVAHLSDVALLKRLRAASGWLGWLLGQFLAQRTAVRSGSLPSHLRLRLIDASTIHRHDSKAPDFRLHLGFDVSTLTIDRVELTTIAQGESLKQFPIQAGELVVADRGYAHRQGIAAVVAAGGAVLVRLNWHNVPLEEPTGAPFDLLAALRSLAEAQVGEWAVRTVAAADGTSAVPGRLLALRKSPKAAEEARRKVRARAKRKGQTPDARTLETAGYLFLFLTLGAEELTAEAALEVYRFRWQIELAFKRMKSLLKLEEMVARDEQLCRAFLCVKLLATLMVEELSRRWADFSPWGYGQPAPVVAVAALSGAGGQRAPGRTSSVDLAGMGGGGAGGDARVP